MFLFPGKCFHSQNDISIPIIAKSKIIKALRQIYHLSMAITKIF